MRRQRMPQTARKRGLEQRGVVEARNVRLLDDRAVPKHRDAVGDAQRELVAPAMEILEKAGVNAELTLLHGRPADEVIRYAEKNNADLVVVGSRGLNALQEFAIGSVSHKIIKHVKCPTLVVK